MTEPRTAADWRARWQPMVDAVGSSADDGGPGADPVELGTIRRFLEPLEFDCPLHYDAEVARAHGYPDVVAPVSSLMMFSLPPIWAFGEPPVFTTAARNAEPPRTNGAPRLGLEPDVPGHVGTDLEFEFFEAVPVGTRLMRSARRLVECIPKETRMGRGAFTKWEMEILTETGSVVATVRFGMYLYEPHEAA